MTLYYMTRDDKSGNRLTTSYDTAEKAKKYGTGENLQDWKGVVYFDPQTGQKTTENTGYVLRSALAIKNENYKAPEGNFVIYAKNEDDGAVFEPTDHRYSTYGLANTAMKSFAGVYTDMLVVEEPKDKTPSEPSSSPPPF